MVEDKLVDRLEQKRDKQRIKKKRKKEERMATGGVFDKYTTENINKLRVKGIIKEFVGIISAGKEANVYFAIGEEDKPLAVKIYKIDPQNTKWMKNYIIGDPRFKKIGNSTHKIIYTWSKKEFKNLKQLHRHNIPVPEPIFCVNNIVLMEYIGEKNGSPAPRLKDVNPLPEPVKIFLKVIQYIEDMYLIANLVHGDLSEYNILYWNDEPIIIDVSQAVSTYHVNAPVFLKRDLINVFNFFGDYLNEKTIGTVDTLYSKIMKAYHNK
ncbi:MAG: serine protein kinase RIO [Promethearchaeota archaeon]